MPDEMCEGSALATEVNNTLTTKLARKKERLETELALITRAEKLLAENPTLKELFDIVSQVRHL